MDYAKLGLKVGLEVHQQLATHKLFCNCESRLVDEVTVEFLRRLRPTQSELGEVDRAALEAAKKNLVFRYQATPTSCLVEADEEPPHPVNPEAVDIALQMALLLGANPVPEVQFMRKIVIDGSNTGGFQRSALVALGGELQVDGKRVGVTTLCLEEDAARPVERREGEVTYRLDRLGIPLVEISTAPDIHSPAEARATAERIGALLRATGRVMRGIGTVREDLNVSIKGGARVEIKGVQELRLISTYVEREVKRQIYLLEATAELRARGVRDTGAETKDLSEVLQASGAKVIRGALGHGGRVLGLRLPGFAGLLADRLGPELAAHARVAGVGGIVHSDELPGYGITGEEVAQVSRALDCGEKDAFVLVADREARARTALERVVARARQAHEGVPEETRDPRPDGSTVYSRPLPGRARMYPETDIAPVRVTAERLGILGKQLPEMPEVRIARLTKEYGLHPQEARQIVDGGEEALFTVLAGASGDPKAAVRTLHNTLPELRAEGLEVERLAEDKLVEVHRRFGQGQFPREAIPNILRRLVLEGGNVDEAVASLGLSRASRAEVERVVEEVLRERAALVESRGEAAVGPLMGLAMERLRGRAEGKIVSEVLGEKLSARRPPT